MGFLAALGRHWRDERHRAHLGTAAAGSPGDCRSHRERRNALAPRPPRPCAAHGASALRWSSCSTRFRSSWNLCLDSATTYVHVGISEYISRTGTVAPGLEARFDWPGFFVLAAFLGQACGLGSTLDLAGWAPVYFNILYLAPLALIARTVTRDPRLVFAAVWLFEIANWVGQDYFSPQGLNYFLYLVIIALILTYFRSSRSWSDRLVERLRSSRVVQEDPGSSRSRGRDRRVPWPPSFAPPARRSRRRPHRDLRLRCVQPSADAVLHPVGPARTHRVQPSAAASSSHPLRCHDGCLDQLHDGALPRRACARADRGGRAGQPDTELQRCGPGDRQPRTPAHCHALPGLHRRRVAARSAWGRGEVPRRPPRRVRVPPSGCAGAPHGVAGVRRGDAHPGLSVRSAICRAARCRPRVWQTRRCSLRSCGRG